MNNLAKTKLLACPKCRGTLGILKVFSKNTNKLLGYRVVCQQCNMKSKRYRSIDKLLEAWAFTKTQTNHNAFYYVRQEKLGDKDVFWVMANYATTEPDTAVMLFKHQSNATLFCQALNAENDDVPCKEYSARVVVINE